MIKREHSFIITRFKDPLRRSFCSPAGMNRDHTHGTYGQIWDIWTDMEHSDRHGTYGRTRDIRTDMGHMDGHGTYGRTWDTNPDIFGQGDIFTLLREKCCY